MNNPFEELEEPVRRRFRVLGWLRNSFLTGLVVIIPIWLTIYLIWTAVGWIDSWVLPFVPDKYHPDAILKDLFGEQGWYGWITGGADVNVNVRGVGVVLFLIFTILVGWVMKGFIGRSLLRWAEGHVERLPVVRSIYNGLKQIAETVFAQTETSFDKACLVEYPRRGIWAIAFISTNARGEINAKATPDEQMVSVFLPTTPNPTSGFLLFLPQSDVIELDMTVEDAAKLVISAGLVYPNGQDPARPPERRN